MRARLLQPKPPIEGADCSVLIPQGLFTANIPLHVITHGVKAGAWHRVGRPEHVGAPAGDLDVSSTATILSAMERVGLEAEQVLDALQMGLSACLLVDGPPPRLLLVQPWLRKHKNAVAADVPLEGVRVSGRRSGRLSAGTSVVLAADDGELLQVDLDQKAPAIVMRVSSSPAGDGRRGRAWFVPGWLTEAAEGFLVASVDPAGITDVTILSASGVQTTRTVNGPAGGALPFYEEKSRTCFVVEERLGRPVLAMWAVPSLQEIAAVDLSAVPLDLDGRLYQSSLLLAVDGDHATLLRSEYNTPTLETVASWSFDEIAADPASPTDDADVAFSFAHRLWGSSWQLAWRSGRIEVQLEGKRKAWRVNPARVEAVIQSLWTERFWDLHSSVAAVPDETWIELSVRGLDEMKTGRLLANAWTRGPGARCYEILEALFKDP